LQEFTMIPIKTIVAVAALVTAASTQAAPLQWQDWAFTGGVNATASPSNRSAVNLSVTGDSVTGGGFSLEFTEGPDAGRALPGVGAGHGAVTGSWSLQLDFADPARTLGLVLALGNFGHGSSAYPGYRFDAWDSSGVAMDRAVFSTLGSFNHRWLSPSFPLEFNDDVDLVGDRFVVTTTAGGADNDSDLLLLALPTGVSGLRVSAIGPMAGDTINVMLASTVPEPASWALAAAGLLLAQLGRRRRGRAADQA
jgi:uncharacterized protein (TIGR03382 family)